MCERERVGVCVTERATKQDRELKKDKKMKSAAN